MADLLTVEQFEVRTQRTFAEASAERAQLEALIADASALAVDLAGDADVTDTWDATAAGTVPGAIVPVLVAMVRRELDNPHGFTAERNFEYSYALASATGVHATRAEAKVLRRAAGRGGIGTLPLEGYMPVRGGESWLDGALS